KSGPNSRSRAAADKPLAKASNLGQLLREDGIGDVVNAWQREFVRTERQYQDGRVGRINLAIPRIVWQIRRKLPTSGVNGGLHIARSRINVPIQIELQGDVGGTQLTRGSHLRNTGDAAELALQRRRDGGGHSFREIGRASCRERGC